MRQRRFNVPELHVSPPGRVAVEDIGLAMVSQQSPSQITTAAAGARPPTAACRYCRSGRCRSEPGPPRMMRPQRSFSSAMKRLNALPPSG